jgi:hypothetical protein
MSGKILHHYASSSSYWKSAMSYAYQLNCHPKTERRSSYTTFFGRKNTGFYIEIGAYNGVDLSNTYFHAQTAR